MFDKRSLPDVVISQGEVGEFSIKLDGLKWFLYKGDKQLMCLSTKTFREYKEQYAFYDLAYGNVLMSGWGFGLAPVWLASKQKVEKVTVVESSREVVQLYLRNNIVPENVEIVFGDIKEYDSLEKYDCLFLDHFPDNSTSPVFDEVSRIAGKIRHDVLWFWSLELRYVLDCIGFDLDDLYLFPRSFDNVDLYSRWGDYVLKYSATIPALEKETVTTYIKTYFNRI